MISVTKVTLLATTITALLTSSVLSAEVRNISEFAPNLTGLAESSGSPEALGEATANAIGLDQSSSLTLEKSNTLPNNAGRTSRFTQTLNGIPIWNQLVIVEQDETGRSIGLEGTAVFDIGPEESGAPTATLSADQALERAKEALTRLTPRAALSNEESSELAPFENEESSLVYFVTSDQQLRLSYVTSFFTTVIDDGGGLKPARPVTIIDAETGETLDSFDNIQFAELGTGPAGNSKTGTYTWGTGTAPKFEVTRSGNNCKMEIPTIKTEDLNNRTSGSGRAYSYNCFNNTRRPINGARSPLNDAQGFGKVVFDMFQDWYGTSPLTNQLHMRVHYSNNYENAFWNGRQMTFGDGATRFHPLVSMDVTAHEVAHGFTEQNSGLVYRNESGGMNEAFSDMAGEAVEYWFAQNRGQLFSGRTMPDLETGADIFKASGKALRYMCNPPLDGRSIGHIRDYRPGMDVHYSSGIYNKAFCILSKRSGWNVKKAFDIFVVANQNYWVPNETFRNGAAKVLKAAKRLRYAEADVIHAFKQVGINLTPPATGNRYIYTTLRVISSSASRGCSSSDWSCMTRICKADLRDQSAWRGWAGCWKEGSSYTCNFECGQVRKLF
jgi:Zn-dependent metalloprotease